MTGISIPDPVSGEIRNLNDLGRRNADLNGLVCPSNVAAKGAQLVAPVSVSKGFSRVH